MSKIGIIISREFNQRVRKRSFIITTIITPILMVGLMAAPIAIMSLQTEDIKEILVVDQSGQIAPKLHNTDKASFTVVDQPVEKLKEQKQDAAGILVIGSDIVTNPGNVQLYTYESSTLDFENNISSQIEDIIESAKLRSYNIDSLPQIMEQIKTDVSLQVYQIDEAGDQKESSSILAMGAAYVFGFMIYMFVLLYGVMVMQGVIEEKTSKVLEIMVSSVKPYELMMGKILGIASVAILQFMIWMVLIFIMGTAAIQIFAGDAISAASMSAGPGMGMPAEMSNMDPEAIAMLKGATDFGFLARLFGGFILYFIGGYLLYAAMFAAIGSAVDDVADSQQLQMPVTIPLILAFVVLMNVMNDPHSGVAFWFSMIPLTSPIIMMARIPYGVPTWQIITSLVLLYASFAAMVWTAGKIYRVGIFMYGKKPSWKELYKWIKYKY